jgi:pimeloyl-ACP methyl ester carboxylesterase
MPLVTLFARPQSSPAAERIACPQVGEHSFELNLPDGRRLSYMTCGAGDGPLVVVLDGPGSRGLARAAARAAAGPGVRLVAPDRPGFGTSTQVAGDRLADWPHDHAALLDALGARRAGNLAQSGGTPYALATAAAWPERTIGVALVAPVGPLASQRYGPAAALCCAAARCSDGVHSGCCASVSWPPAERCARTRSQPRRRSSQISRPPMRHSCPNH